MSRKLVVEIIGDASSLQKAFAKSEKSAKQFDQSIGRAGQSTKRQSKLFGGMGKTVGLLAGGLGVAGLAGAARAAFSEFSEAQKVTAQTRAVLKSTGGAANVTAEHVDALATSLMNLSGQDDEAIKSAENMLLTFTDVRNEAGKGNDIFDQATKTVLDMSVALGQDTRQSALQLGKALNDPVKGVGALRRVGVAFTKDQATLIKKLVDSGHTMEAQKIILGELRKEFGGSAKAAGQTMAGQIDRLKNTLLNLGGSIAETLAPTIQKLLTQLNKWLSNSKNQKQVLDTVKQVVGALTTGIKALKTAFEFLNKITGSTKHTLELLVAVVAGFKVLQFASKVKTLADNLGLVGTNAGKAKTGMAGAKGASTRLSASFLGKAGLVVGAGAAAYELTSLGLKATGLDKKLMKLGGSVFDLASDLGLINDPMKQFEGKTILKPADITFLQRQAAGLAAKGLSVKQIVDEILRTHPKLAKRDVESAIGVRASGGVFNINTLVVQAENPKQLEQELHRRTRGRAQTRRGAQ